MSDPDREITPAAIASWLGVPVRRVHAYLDSQRIACEYRPDGSRRVKLLSVLQAVAAGELPAPKGDLHALDCTDAGNDLTAEPHRRHRPRADRRDRRRSVS